MPSAKKYPTQERLKELLHFEPGTGHFTWLVSRNSNNAIVGSLAGSVNGRGYIQIRIDGVRRYAHRLAFVYMMGELPPKDVDHLNRNRADNRWANLRPASRRENEGNKGLRGDNTSRHRGVTWDKQAGKWRARGTRDGRRIHLGRFENIEEAAAIARAWREKNFGIFATAA